MRKKQSQEILNEASKCIAHEIKSLRMALLAHEEIHNQNNSEPSIIKNALIMAFAIHFRNIYDFMYAGRNEIQRPRPSDIIAEDFFKSPEDWRNAILNYPESAGKIKKRMNKLIAHLTYDQISLSSEEKLWDLTTMLNDLCPAIEAFYRRSGFEYFKDIHDELKHPLWRGRVTTLFSRHP